MKLLLNKVFFRVSKHVGLWPLLLPARTFLPSEKRFLVVVQRIHCCWPPQKEDDYGKCCQLRDIMIIEIFDQIALI